MILRWSDFYQVTLQCCKTCPLKMSWFLSHMSKSNIAGLEYWKGRKQFSTDDGDCGDFTSFPHTPLPLLAHLCSSAIPAFAEQSCALAAAAALCSHCRWHFHLQLLSWAIPRGSGFSALPEGDTGPDLSYYRDKQRGLELHTIHTPPTIPAAGERGTMLWLSGIHITNNHCPRLQDRDLHPHLHSAAVVLGPKMEGAALAHRNTLPMVHPRGAPRARATGGLQGSAEGLGLCPAAEDPWQEHHRKEAGNVLSPILGISFQGLRISCFH